MSPDSVSAPTAGTEVSIDDETWSRLTIQPTKRAHYEEDLYFRECWADVANQFGADAIGTLDRLALLSFKCDGVVGRRMKPTVRYVQDRGFDIVGYRSGIRHNRHSIRELWRFNWNVYPVDRLALMSLMHTRTDVMVLLLNDVEYDGQVPASVRLADLKGSANPADRKPDHLRSVLQPPNAVINFVHIADEPADVVREAGILLDLKQRREVLSELAPRLQCRQAVSVDDAIDAMEAAAPSSDFDLESALTRVTDGARLAPEQVRRLKAAVRGDDRALSWQELTAIVDPDAPTIRFWDFVRIATEVLPQRRDGTTDLLPAVTPSEWVQTNSAAQQR